MPPVKFQRGKGGKGEGLGDGAGVPAARGAAGEGGAAAALGHREGCAMAPQSIGGKARKPASSKCPE